MTDEIKKNHDGEKNELLPSDFYMEGTRKVYTEYWHIKRGVCCGSVCRHCPYEPKYERGSITLIEK